MLLLKSLVSVQGYSVYSRIVRVAVAILCGAILAQPSPAEMIYAIANQAPGNFLLRWDSATPGNIISGQSITNLPAGVTLLGIDFRPATGELYAVGSSAIGAADRLYKIDQFLAVANTLPLLISPNNLNGFSFGFDFNPVVDRVRIVSDANQNMVVDPVLGGVLTVGPNVFYAAGDPNFGVDPNLVDLAYTNNFAGAANTQLFGIDTGLDVLVTMNTATGALTTIGPLGVNVVAAGGFDISGNTGIAYAALQPSNGSQSSLYTINLATGAAAAIGQIDGGIVISAMAVAPDVPEPAAAALMLLGLIGLSAARRRAG